ncbi:MAG: hypothetical protein ABIE70_09790 [bacterium]
MQHSIEIRDTGIKITDILGLIARGLSYYQILLFHKDLTLTDIMVTARIAQELIENFVDVSGELHVEGNIEVSCRGGKLRNLTEVRNLHPQAFEPWTDTEDADLRAGYKEGQSVVTLAEKHGRQRGAVKTRLRKLGLTQKP